MGIPVTFFDFLLPKSFLFVFTLLDFIRNLVSDAFLTRETPPSAPPEPKSATASLIRELNLFPVVRFSEVEVEGDERCAVCLSEFEVGEEIRRLRNCQHTFHRGCVDRWMDQDKKTCPLCRKNVIPEDMAEAFHHRLWAKLSAMDEPESDYLSVAQSGGFF